MEIARSIARLELPSRPSRRDLALLPRSTGGGGGVSVELLKALANLGVVYDRGGFVNGKGALQARFDPLNRHAIEPLVIELNTHVIPDRK